MNAMPSQTPWQCDICHSHFSRREHLRRHSMSHENKRPYECHYCRRSFKRSDTLRRHERACKAPPLSPDGNTENSHRPWKRTGHAREPDNQDHLDNQLHPLLRGVESVENQGIEAPEYDFITNLPFSFDFTALDWLCTPSAESDLTHAERLEYLAYFTSARGMATFLDRETLREKQNMISEYYTTISISTEEDDTDYALLHGTAGIIHYLQSTITTDSAIIKTSIPSWTTETHHAATQLFSPANISRFLTFFWALWYPNCPIVHRPLFDPGIASPALLAVMVIIGACLSPDEEDGRLARKWMDAVEVMTFRQEWFVENTASSSTIEYGEEGWKRRLECIQTAYLVCSLQKREGSVEAQGRVRRHRHAMMVTLARDIELATATHPRDLPANASAKWWRRFAAEEELIRTLTYVFLFDAALTIFHNSPPRMVVSELKMDMACPEGCFQAESAEISLLELQQWSSSVFWRETLPVVSVVRRMCQGELLEDSIMQFSCMGTLNLFTTVQSLHSLTFHLQNSLIGSTLSPVQTGLESWRCIWNKRQPEDQHVPNHPHTLWKQIGFVRYAPEFWHLARILVTQVVSSAEGNECSIGDKKGKRYDHTDMMDVNGLIVEYRRLNLGVCT